MKEIAPMIIEGNLEVSDILRTRETVRALLFNQEQEALMVYSSLFDDYTFAGGGIKKRESHLEALKRELKEELGANTVTILEPYGFIKELRYGLKGNDDVYLQTSYYYIVSIKSFGSPNFVGREQLHGLQMKWVDLRTAYLHNEQVLKDDLHQTKGLNTVLVRENAVIKQLLEEKNEKI